MTATCERCGATDREVARGDGAWLCLACFLRSANGYYLADHELEQAPFADQLRRRLRS
jgi:hypothetical protein